MRWTIDRLLLGIVFLILSGCCIGWFHSLLFVWTSLFVCGVALIAYDFFTSCAFIIRRKMTKLDLILSFLLLSILAIHGVGLFLPEVSFDALWYHLPITHMIAQRGFLYIPELYQSAGPRLGEAIFAIPYHFFGVNGARAFAFLVSILLVQMVYRLSRIFVSRTWSLFILIAFSLFHVFSWQSTAVYVDLLRSVFELSALYLILKQRFHSRMLPLLLAVAIFTKYLSIPFVLICIIVIFQKNLRVAVSIAIQTFWFLIPFLFQNYLWTSNPIFPLFSVLDGKEQLLLEGASTFSSWFWSQIQKIPSLPFRLFYSTEGYTSAVFVCSVPLLLLGAKKITSWNDRVLFLVGITGIIFWWFLPPISIRYQLSAIICFLILSISFMQRSAIQRKICAALLISSAVFSIITRFGVIYSNRAYYLDSAKHNQYIQIKTQGILQTPAMKWYSGYWENKKY